MKFSSFQKMASRYARVVAPDGRGLRVTFGGKMAFTSPGHMNLPGQPAGTVLTHWMEKVYCGYLEHEIGHQLYTDFAQFTRFASQSKLIQYLTNLIEDIRIENKRIEEVPHVREELDSLCIELDTKTDGGIKMEGRDIHVLDKALVLLYKYLYTVYRNIDTRFTSDELDNHAELIPIRQAVDQGMPGVKSTQTAGNLAVKLAKMMASMVKEGKLKPGDLGVEEQEKKLLELDPNALWVLLSGSIHVPDHHEDRIKIISLLSADIGDDNKIELPSELKLQLPIYAGSKVLPPATTEFDRVFVYPGENMFKYEQVKREVDAETKALKKMLNIFLRSKDRRAWIKGLDEGTLDDEVLYQFKTGSKRLMKELVEKTMVNTAVELMIDLSTSMDEEAVQRTAICTCEALNDIRKVKLEIAGFTSNERRVQNNQKQGVGRLQGIDIMLFKGFDESYKASRGKLGAIRTISSTPLGDAYGYALERLVTRSEPKRVLFLVTDGAPSYAHTPEHSDYLMMMELREKAARMGIITVALDICSRYMQKAPGVGPTAPYVKYSVVCNDIRTLPEALMKTIREFM